ncbi:ribokinase [Carnobacterium sp. PL24RED07]|uniref:ribokinase n=1 Tax=unclassified Carnobacterium TaxID=257487 RepID=UPI0011EEEED1|nr:MULTISPECIES: ribokinase [unclassified Carnobacterium]KAF3299743.1 ribokinase [Carnobacterium sp. PL26RED25]KAF3304536.1 ribokinase [Carnobacterium sp. PL24RED07]
MNKITVIGSISTDFVATTAVLPEMGETVEGENFERSFGGKGANQAVAIGRLGGHVEMIGAVGEDTFGKELLANLRDNHVLNENVERVTGFPSGTAVITLYKNDNAIIYVAGANNQMPHLNSDAVLDAIKQSDLVIIQNEMPQSQIDQVIDYCQANAIKVLYNPAPARKLDRQLIEKITYLTPNEKEFQDIFPELSISEGLERYHNKLFVTLGSKGVIYNDGNHEVLVPAYKVTPVDTTGAGDTFNGAFGLALTNGLSIEQSVKFGNLAAALSIQKFGAQGGMPTMEEMKGSAWYEEKWDFE